MAELVTRGLSNTEVAAELGMSVKTVEYHLGKIYTRCGVRTRAQLTRQLVEAEIRAETSRDARRTATA